MTEPCIHVHLNMSGTLTLANFMKIASLIEPETYEVDLGSVGSAGIQRSAMNASVALDPELRDVVFSAQVDPDIDAPAETASTSKGVVVSSPQIDADGHPFDPALHTGTITKAGLWRMKAGISRPAPMPGFPKTETLSETSTLSPAISVADGATAQAGSTLTEVPASAVASPDEDDEFAAFRAASEKVDAAEAAAAANVPARVWTDADLAALCNQAAVKLNDPTPIKALIAEYVPAGEVAHSRNVPADKRAAFVAAVEAKAGIEFAG